MLYPMCLCMIPSTHPRLTRPVSVVRQDKDMGPLDSRPKLSTDGAATRMTLQHITDNLEELRADQVTT